MVQGALRSGEWLGLCLGVVLATIPGLAKSHVAISFGSSAATFSPKKHTFDMRGGDGRCSLGVLLMESLETCGMTVQNVRPKYVLDALSDGSALMPRVMNE